MWFVTLLARTLILLQWRSPHALCWIQWLREQRGTSQERVAEEKLHDFTLSSDLDPQRSQSGSIMIINSTLQPSATPNAEDPSSQSSSSVGLAVGLTLFVVIAIVAGGIVYKFKSKLRNLVQSGLRRGRGNQKKTDHQETTRADSHHTDLIREQPAEHNPIYANYTRPAAQQSGSPEELEEDLYLQCDSPDNAIYGNDPTCNLVICDPSQEEDVYIMPDS